MGLAASQARFLAVTARKTNCEFQSMQIAQNKLSVTRELAQATQDYQNSLNATKLVWDYDCDQSGYLIEPCENAKSLAFNTLMVPSIYNNYQPYLITTRTGAIVLNSKYAAAAKAARITEGVGGQKRTQDGFHRFLDALVTNGLLPESTNEEIKKDNFVIYQGKMAEDGGTVYIYDHILDSTKDEDKALIDENRLINVEKYNDDGTIKDEKGYIVGYDQNAGFGSQPISKNPVLASNILGLYNKLNTDSCDEIFNTTIMNNFSDDHDDASKYKVAENGGLIDEKNAKEITIGDLLTEDITVVYTLPDNNYGTGNLGERKPDLQDVRKYLNDNNFQNVVNADIDKIIEILGKNTQYDAVMLKQIGDAVKSMYAVDMLNGEAGSKRDTSGAVNSAISNANNYNCLYAVTTLGNKYNCSVAYSLSNVLACILTLADRYINGSESKYDVSDKVEDSNFVTMDENYNYPVKTANGTDQEILLLTDFYMQLYNNLCINGWTENKAVENDYNFNQLIKNGSYFISSINGDGYFYQSRYNSVDKLIEVKDEDAIAQAELEFQRIKASLTYKEDKLDLDMKNLDAEISSLTTELDSVKNLISKNVEKTFTMFQ